MSLLRGCTLREWRASSVESRTLEECAPSLRDILMEYSLSDLPRPWLRSYNSKVMCDYGGVFRGLISLKKGEKLTA